VYEKSVFQKISRDWDLSYSDLDALVGKDESGVSAGEFGGRHLDELKRIPQSCWKLVVGLVVEELNLRAVRSYVRAAL